MYRILLLSHGNLAEELLKSAELIMGAPPAEAVATIPLPLGKDMAEYKAEVETYVSGAVAQGECLILADLAGGSPFITAAGIYRTYMEAGNVDVITGVNLTMLIEALSAQEHATLAEVRKIVLEEGHAGIQALSSTLTAQQ
ncbi:PTS sugar transporter subunit IIA [Oscillospiraceae bacterium LTW-04]|nr:hypothetical protein RBH76_01120 [Oscillospiraceae bacterium MB24-C1]